MHYDFEVPEELRDILANFPVIFNEIHVGKDDLRTVMEKCSEEKNLHNLIRENPKVKLFLDEQHHSYTICAPLIGPEILPHRSLGSDGFGPKFLFSAI